MVQQCWIGPIQPMQVWKSEYKSDDNNDHSISKCFQLGLLYLKKLKKFIKEVVLSSVYVHSLYINIYSL